MKDLTCQSLGLLTTLALAFLMVACNGGETRPAESPRATGVGPEVRSIIEELCPDIDTASHAVCVNDTIAAIDETGTGVLCTNEESGDWYVGIQGATPDPALDQEASEGETLGDACQEPGHTVVALMGGGQFAR